MRLIEITDNYIDYMKKYFFSTMLDNKEGVRKHGRKYLGIVLTINDNNYFAPLSSPKSSDYAPDGTIRESSSIVLRMVKDYRTNPLLLGTIKLNNMIPVPNSEIIDYDLNNESDIKYKNLIIDELDWIQQNTTKIINSANRLYNTKINESTARNNKNGKFFDSIISFKDAEEKCKLYIHK